MPFPPCEYKVYEQSEKTPPFRLVGSVTARSGEEALKLARKLTSRPIVAPAQLSNFHLPRCIDPL